MERVLDASTNFGPRRVYRLFVTGLLPSTTNPEVEVYLSRFGEMKVITSGRQDSGVRILETEDRQVFRAVLGVHQWAGRSISVCKYREGKELVAYNCLMNQRRIVIKRVPQMIPVSALEQYLRQHFGPLEALYPFQSPPGRAPKQFISYSALFVDKIAAKQAVSVGTILLRNCIISIEKFKRKKKTSNANVRQSAIATVSVQSLHHLPGQTGAGKSPDDESGSTSLGCSKPTSRQYFMSRSDLNVSPIGSSPIRYRFNILLKESSSKDQNRFRKGALSVASTRTSLTI